MKLKSLTNAQVKQSIKIRPSVRAGYFIIEYRIGNILMAKIYPLEDHIEVETGLQIIKI
ncbi:MAG: hypothetical protein Q8O55_08750 [Dehalococcoidales bacterium]|nr:hypothetical protein [Dehalococcoidales bacterium]